jgi:CRP/FNR family transcriptional regulator, anaerobic regulatory protein
MAEHTKYWEMYFPQFIENMDNGLEKLMGLAQKAAIPRGLQVFSPGSRCENYLLLLEGCVKTQLISENGREVLLYYVRSGDSCVLTTSCLLSGDHYPAEGITDENVTAFVIPAAVFHETLDQSSYFRQFVFKNFAKRLSNVIARMEQVVFGPIDLRLARALLDANKKVIRITHHELAVELGSAREVVSRHLKRYEAYGWVCLNRGTVEIKDFTALQKLSEWKNIE